MPSPTAIPVPNGFVKVVSRKDLSECEAWAHAFQARCKDHRYYDLLEETLEGGFEHRYLLLEDSAGQVRAIQPFFFVRQNLIEGAPALKPAVDFIRKKLPRFLTMRVLMVGCAGGEGHLDAASPEEEQWIAQCLHASLQTIARREKASLVILKDFPARYRGNLQNFSANGYARIPSMPYTKLALPYTNFEEYLNSLGKATRKNLRRKFRKVEQAPKIELEVVNDITPYVDEIYPLYLQVHKRSPLKFETLTKDYFCSLGRQMPERTRFFLWRQLGRIIAFSVCLVHDDTIYDEYLGMDYGVALDLHLYYYTIRDIISWSLEQGLKFYCSSPLNYDPKLHLGCDLVPLDLYVRHTAAVLNPVFRRVIKYLGPTQHDPVLRQFRNAHEL